MLIMVTEPQSCVVSEEAVDGRLPNKMTQGKVPKKIHKAEREKLKRDQLNELFLELAHALEPARQNNGKASILNDATRILRELVEQVESLRKENEALVTESHYVAVEKNELKDENFVLETEIAKLQNELREKLQSPTWQTHVTNATLTALPSAVASSATQPPPVAPLYIVPLPQDLQAFPEPEPVSITTQACDSSEETACPIPDPI